MKVSNAAQVFSHKVALVIKLVADNGMYINRILNLFCKHKSLIIL